MLVREESACQLQTCYPIGNDLSHNDSLCCAIQNKTCSDHCNGLKNTAVMSCTLASLVLVRYSPEQCSSPHVKNRANVC